MSRVTCHIRPLISHIKGRSQACHAIIALGKHTRCRKTSSMVCLHPPWTARTVGRRRSRHAIVAFGHHRRSHDDGHYMPSLPFGSRHSGTTLVWWPSSPLDITYDRGRRAWHAIIAIGLHIQWDDVWRFMSLSHLGSTHGQITLGIACHLALGQHTWSDDVKCGMPSSLLDDTKDRTSSGVACHHRPWAAHTVKRRLVWHTIIAIGKHTRS